MSKGVKDVTTQEVIDMLTDGPHEVIFEKLDGTIRQMTATLNQDFLQTIKLMFSKEYLHFF